MTYFKAGTIALLLAAIIPLLAGTPVAASRIWGPPALGGPDGMLRVGTQLSIASQDQSWEFMALPEMEPRPVPLRTCPLAARAAPPVPSSGSEAARRLPAKRNGINRIRPGEYRFSLSNADDAAASRYEVHDKVVDGWWGKVATATHRPTGETVAIKQAPVKVLALEAALLHVFQKSEGVMSIRDVMPLKNNSGSAFGYIVFEKMDGMATAVVSLWDGGQNSVPPDDMRRLLLNILLAVHHLHKNFVIHGDLKSANVMYQRKGCKIKLIDAGISLPHAQGSGIFPVYGYQIKGQKGPAPEWFGLQRSKIRSRGFITWEQAVQAELFALGEVLLDFLVGAPSGLSEYMHRRLAWDSSIRYPGSTLGQRFMVVADMVGRPPREVLQRDYSPKARELLEDMPMKPAFPLTAAFPNVDRGALAMVESLMNMDRTKRPSVRALLRHPYFAGLLRVRSGGRIGRYRDRTAVDRRVREMILEKRLYKYVRHGSLHTEEALSSLYGELAGVYQRRHAAGW